MRQTFFLINWLIVCWLWMQIVHELGHVFGALVTEAAVDRVVLHPLTISRTDFSGGSSPLAVVWLGPIVGVLLPLAAWGIALATRFNSDFLLRFFAGFCLIVNGAYLAGGSFERIGDCGELIKLGTPIYLLWLFGAVTVPAGLWLWHGQAARFGLGPQSTPTDQRTIRVVSSLALGTILAELVWDWLVF